MVNIINFSTIFFIKYFYYCILQFLEDCKSYCVLVVAGVQFQVQYMHREKKVKKQNIIKKYSQWKVIGKVIAL